jgi:hypothetical protein
MSWDDLFSDEDLPETTRKAPDWETPVYELVRNTECQARAIFDEAVAKLDGLNTNSRRFERNIKRILFRMVQKMKSIEGDPVVAAQMVLNLEPRAYWQLYYSTKKEAELDLVDKHMSVKIPAGVDPLVVAIAAAREHSIHFQMEKDYFSEARETVWNVCRQMSLLFPNEPFGISQSRLGDLLDLSQGCVSKFIRDGVKAGYMDPAGKYSPGRHCKHYWWFDKPKKR